MEIGDYENYTVWVHALKGNARLIGAAKLSSDAAYLEQCGNERNADLIQKETPKLLEFYRSYLDKLAPIAARDQVDHENLQDITEQEFVGALRDLKELVEVFDYDNAISIRNMLDQYRIPEAYQTKWETIKERMAAVDMEGLLAELKDVIVETELDV